MLSRRIVSARPFGLAALAIRRTPLVQKKYLSQADIDDPNMNGGYVNPPPIKRQFRDPYADWWDKQDRRNYGEPVHEDNDIMGLFSLEEYTHVTPGKGLFQLGCFIAAVLGLCGVVAMTYPDTPSYPREFPDGLEEELGGSKVVKARVVGDPFP